MNWDNIKQSVDEGTSQSVVSALQSMTKGLLLAPFRCISFSVMSGLLLGKRFKKFVTISFIVCMAFVGVSVGMLIYTQDLYYTGYILSGVLAYFLVITLFHKDLGHKALLNMAKDFTESEEDLELAHELECGLKQEPEQNSDSGDIIDDLDEELE